MNNSLQGKYITISYTFSSDSGEVLGTSDISGPFTFCYGAGDTIPGLEEHLEGVIQGQIMRFTIPAEKAYGIRNPDLVKVLPKSSFPQSLQLATGLQLFVNNEKVTVTEYNDQHVTVDSNHPLAGLNLNFELSVLEISDDPPQTQAHGCGCGSGGCGCSA